MEEIEKKIYAQLRDTNQCAGQLSCAVMVGTKQILNGLETLEKKGLVESIGSDQELEALIKDFENKDVYRAWRLK